MTLPVACNSCAKHFISGRAHPIYAFSNRQLSSSATTELPPLVYDDSHIKSTLAMTRVIAMVGASESWNRPSNFAMKYLQAKGYRVIPVNPKAAKAGIKILGEVVYKELKEIPEQIDMVDVFRGSVSYQYFFGAAISATSHTHHECARTHDMPPNR